MPVGSILMSIISSFWNRSFKLYWTIIGTLVCGLIGLGVYIYFWRKGQFDDIEDIKYQLFRDEEE